MKRNKRWQVLLLALVMTMTLAACGNRPTDDVAAADDAAGQLEQDASKPDDAKRDEQKPTDTKTDAETKTDANTDDTKTDNTKTDDTKQDEQKPADTKQDTTSEADSKTDTKTDTKPADTKPAAPSYDNGSLTTAQVKEMQRWYGIGADGQWGDGSKSAAGGRTADEAWNNYQQNKQAAAPDSGNTGSTGGSTTPDAPSTPDVPADSGSSGSSTGGSTTPSTPAKPIKADIDCDEVVRVGNEYAESLGFEIWDGCSGYMTPIYFEEDYTDWSQERANAAIKEMVDAVKTIAIREGRWSPRWDVPEGSASAVNCSATWNASAGYHEFYVYFAA